MLYTIKLTIILALTIIVANYLKDTSKPAQKPVKFFKNIMGTFSIAVFTCSIYLDPIS